MDALNRLRARLMEISDLRSVGCLLDWDQSTHMPDGGAEARGRQLALVGRLAHERQIETALGDLLDELRPLEEGLAPDSDDASLIRVARRDYLRAVRVPAAFAERLADHLSRSYVAWTKARPADDFAQVAPYLERTLELSRELAGFFPGAAHVADPLIDQQDEGLDVAITRALFDVLRPELVALAGAIADRPQVDASCLSGAFPEEKQLGFGDRVIRSMGYDFDRGRQDKTHHPFMTKMSLGDVRITTRIKLDDVSDAFFSTVHEAGHALYEQGIRRDFEGTPLGVGTSAGVHESQSRLWENLVARGRPFWSHFFPQLQAVFPAELGGVPVETFYRALNKVQRSLIRTDADEVTYNLHVMIRFDLELAMLEGRLAIKDLPTAWRDRYKSDLGIDPGGDKDGVLQDVHWYAGPIGGTFQGYTVGNVLAAQFYDAALAAKPSIPDEIGRGELGTLRGWLTDNLYQHGRKFLMTDLVTRATGKPLTTAPYLGYLRKKFGDIYGIS